MKTIFTHDTDLALASVAELVNTLDGDDDTLTDVDALDKLVEGQGWTGAREHSHAELRAVRDLRPRLRRIWQADEDEIVRIVNALLREHNALPQIIKHDGTDYHLHAVPRDAPLATRMAVEAAMAVADVVRAKELSRLRTCDYPTCDRVLVDLSKNRSKRFCDNVCANRAAVAAYRVRRRRER
ncbi:CGNR zinc finger domain-containing protein [Fodinicola acaciae]|uniref:CGNR zinc finger domain-containing protein n=1 Tax=Fodinicola acaciae TaxID=2681555 RepID=UPI0013D37131|nr:CGNR zinc finger domain-containing protein [Fodinicola acaciae]